MSRAKKILIVGFVLAVGIGLAWPFRKTTTEVESKYRADPMQFTSIGQGIDQTRTTMQNSAAEPSKRHTVATMTSTAENASSTNVPIAGSQLNTDSSQLDSIGPTSTTPPDQPAAISSEARPAYSIANRGTNREDLTEWPREIVYVVHNGDTLEKLAKRYLGDASRALEIFDMNRDQLTNPHLLPIGAELRVPVETNPQAK